MAGLRAKWPFALQIRRDNGKRRAFARLNFDRGKLRAKMPHEITFAFLAM
jgi:hypothetical protein